MSEKPSTEVLLISDLRKSFGKRTILHNFNLKINPGQALGMIGPNGAGKSTLVRCITGLLIPDHGHIIIAGHSLATEPLQARTALRLLAQELTLPKGITGRELLEFYASTFQDRKSIDKLIALAGLGEQIDHLVTTYSFGQQRRLTFAGLCAGSGRLFILDEPFAGLDREAQQMIKNELRIRLQHGAGLVLTGHHEEDEAIRELCPKIIHIGP